MVTDQSGNAFVTGRLEYDAMFSSQYAVGGNATNGVTVALSQGQTGTYLAKYDPAGNLLWAENGGGCSLGTDAQGNTYAVGNFSGTLWLENSTIVTNSSGAVTNLPGTLTNLTSGGSTDMSLIKYDPSGKAVWARGLSLGNATYAYAIALDGAANIFTASGVSSTTNSINFDYYVTKFDPTGQPLWTNYVKSDLPVEGLSLAVAADGKALVAGSFTGSMTLGDTTLTALGLRNVLAVEFGPGGQLLWAERAGGFNWEFDVSAAAGPGDDTWVSGSFWQQTVIGGTTLTQAGGGLFVARLASGLPSIISQPQNLRTDLGATVSFCVAVTNAPNPRYQWFKDNVKLADDARISGSQSPCLTIGNVQTNDLGNYTVVIQADTGTVTSSPAALWVGPLTQFVSTTMLSSGILQVDFTGEPGRLYIIEASTNLTFAYPVPVTNFYCGEGLIRVIDPQAWQYPNRFYRAVSAK